MSTTTDEWLRLPAMSVAYRLTTAMRVPEPIADAIERRLNASEMKDLEIEHLQRRIAYLEQHVPEEIRNPPPPSRDMTRFTGD